MKSTHWALFASLIALLCMSLPAHAQTVTATPSPKPADETDVVKISTNLIQIDATVTDKKGNLVTDLKPGDFEIYQNGQKQTLTNFSFVAAPNASSAPPVAPPQKNSAVSVPLPSKTLRPEQVRRTIAIVVDDLSLSFESIYHVRESLKKFVSTQMQDGDLVAIIRTGGGVGALQQFTSDRRQLAAAIDKISWNFISSGKIGAFAPIEATPLQQLQANGTKVSAEQLAAEKLRVQRFNDFQGSVFATGTLGALNFIVKGMRDLPGRKSVMLMSDGFQLFTRSEAGFSEASTLIESLRRLTDLANRSAVVIYTIDARGLQTLNVTAEESSAGMSPAEFEQKLSDRRNEFFDSQDGLIYLARETGGMPLINNNDLNVGIAKMLADLKGYYLLGFVPDSETFDPEKHPFNQLTVKLVNPELRVRYRSGFVGATDEEVNKPTVQTPQMQMASAITSPFAENGIELRLNTLFGSDAKTGVFVSSYLHIAAKDLKFTDEPDGTHQASFDILALGFTDTGMIADRSGKGFTITLKDENYQKFLHDGFVYNFIFPIKKPGAYQMRVALRDSSSGKIGSANQFIEVPDLKKGKLTLSGIVLKNMTTEELSRLQSGDASAGVTTNPATATTSEADNSLKQFKRSTILQYGYDIYNLKGTGTPNPPLTVQTRLFCNGKLLFEGKPSSIPGTLQPDAQKINSIGGLSLGDKMELGDYVLQIIVNDLTKPDKPRTTSQWTQFEIIE